MATPAPSEETPPGLPAGGVSPATAPSLSALLNLAMESDDTLAPAVNRMGLLRRQDPEFARDVERRFLLAVLSRIESKSGAYSDAARRALKICGWEAPSAGG